MTPTIRTFHVYDATTGQRLRAATADEVAAYEAGNVRSGVRVSRVFDRAVVLGDVAVNVDSKPSSHIPGRFL